MQNDHSVRYDDLRKTYPVLIYESYSVTLREQEILLEFHFILSETFHFRPVIAIPVKKEFDLRLIHSDLVRSIVFHIGMVELISYWKAACPPVVIVKAAQLTPVQAEWWKKLFYHGLGEFFYTNGIIPEYDDFLTIFPDSREIQPFSPAEARVEEAYLIPVGGGKDSCVTLRLLEGHTRIPFILNPRKTTLDVIKIMGFEKEKALFMFRDIDPLLLELNNMGFLNGHTPFSALLAFLSLLAAVLRGATHIALSNESSANEPTIPHTTINHQYSKSFGFERDFRQYCSQYLCSNINYFSLLRPLNELQIAKMFATIPESFHVFHSCNAASKSDTWCCKCAKCLFTFIILSPFLPLREVEKIFGANLLEDASLSPLLDQLTGADQEKPFECVGTVREVNAALQVLGQVLTPDQWPLLLRCYIDAQEHTPFGISFDHLIHEVNPVNFVPVEWEKHLREIVNGW